MNDTIIDSFGTQLKSNLFLFQIVRGVLGPPIGANKFEKCWIFFKPGFNRYTVTVLENHNRSKALGVILNIFKLYICRRPRLEPKAF